MPFYPCELSINFMLLLRLCKNVILVQFCAFYYFVKIAFLQFNLVVSMSFYEHSFLQFFPFSSSLILNLRDLLPFPIYFHLNATRYIY